MEDRVKRFVLAIAATAAVTSFNACSRQEPVPAAPVETISNHATVEIVWDWL